MPCVLLDLREKKTYGYMEHNEAKRQAFLEQLATINPHDIVYADEAGMDNRIGLWLWMELAVVKAFTH